MTLVLLASFAFATVGSKLAAALVFIYFLLPRSGRCSACDGMTVPMIEPPPLEQLLRSFRLRRRFCTGCGRTELARRMEEARVFVGEPRRASREAAPRPESERRG